MKEKDPVCGMTVDTESAVAHSSHQGLDHFFCSTACQRKFEAHPDQFVSQDDPPFTKLDGIVAPKFGSAGSGGLEYEPLPK